MAVMAMLSLFTGLPLLAADPPCVPVTTRFVGLPATNCIIPSVAAQQARSVCETCEDGFPNSYLQVTLTNIPPGYSVTNGVYKGWCVDYDGELASFTLYKPIMYLSTAPLPPQLAHTNWDMVNYILNHKQGTAIDVQAAIWRFIGGPVPFSDPVFYRLSAAGSNMVAEASAFGEGYVPGPGEVSAVILDLGPVFQMNIIEVSCPGILQACPGGIISLCTTNRGSAPMDISWFKNGIRIAGANGACLNLSGLQSSDAAVYSIQVTNNCGAATNFVQLVITNNADGIPPVITCASNRFYQCLSQVPPTPDFGSVSATDNSGPVTVMFVGETLTTNGCEILVLRRYLATDPCGNVSFCDRTDRVLDVTPPILSAVPPNATYQCISSVPPVPVVTAIDNCDTNVTVFVSSTIAGVCPKTIQTRWWAIDRCGNGVTNIQTVTVADTISPSITCPPDLVAATLAAVPPCYTELSAFQAAGGTAMDNCDFPLEYHCADGPLIGNFCSGYILRTHTVMDGCARVASCVQRINIATNPPPVISCPPALLVQCSNNIPACPGSLASFIAQGGSAAGSNLVYACSDAALSGGTCGGTLARTHTVTDACGNRASCTQLITVRDTIPPVITCGLLLIVECGSPWNFTAPTVMDNCDGTNVALIATSTVTNRAGFCGSTFSVTRNWRATDGCNNASTCSQTITIVDTTPPALTCAANEVVECGTAWTFPAPSASDICDSSNVSVTVVSTITNRVGFCGNSFSVTRTWRAIDACNNTSTCSQTITVVDAVAPRVTCAENKMVECGTTWVFTPPTALDVCDGTNVVISVSGTITNRVEFCGNTFSATRTWRVTDACTNASTCSQTITVVDTTAPTIVCARDQVVECGGTWTFTTPTASDVCDGTNVAIAVVSTVTNRAGFCGNTFSATRTWRATDACANSAVCSQTITVVDTTAPTLTCALDRIVECGSAWTFSTPGVSDVCDGTNVTVAILSTVTNRSGFCGATSSATRTWRATDSCTNTATCSQTITIVDTTPPSLTCAANRTAECGAAWVFDQPTAGDLCGASNVTIRILSTVTNRSGFCGNTFAATRVWEATDACQNTASCSQTITVVDTTPPIIASVPADAVYQCLGDVPPMPVVTANDLCDGTNVILRAVSNTAPDGCGYLVTQSWTATDQCSNSVTRTRTIRVRDTLAPVVSCAADKVVECGTAWGFDAPHATDNCDTNPAIRIVSTVTNRVGFCGNTFSATRTWEALDTCTNRSTCSQTVRVIDLTLPTLSCAASITVECGLPWQFTPPTPMDSCDATNVTVAILSTTTNRAGFCGNTYAVTRAWIATDACTNTSICTQTITFIDTTPPVLTGIPADESFQCLGDVPAIPRVTPNDLCDGTNVQLVATSTISANGCGWLVTQSWTATDGCSNSVTRSRVITVRDTLPPTLNCAANKVAECGETWNFDAPSASDSCDTNPVVRIVSTLTNRTAFCGNTFSVTRLWEAVDACTNRATCSQTVTIVDTRPPVLSCAPGRIVECGTAWAFTAPTANDICDATNVAITVLGTTTNRVGFCGNTFSATRTWRAVDACSNAATCTQTITVMDTQPPDITCAFDKIVQCGVSWTFDAPTASDPCSGTNVTIRIVGTITNTAVCPAKLIAVRTWEAMDACSNVARCSQTVTIVDTTAPELTCEPGFAVECGATWAFATPSARDLCDGANVTVRVVGTVTNAGVCPVKFIITRTWEAADQCTNLARCSQTVTIRDTTAPTLVCAPDATVPCGTNFTFTTPVGSDICDGANVTVSVVSTVTNALCGRTFFATRTWRALDGCGNSAQCSQKITVIDTTPPVLQCAANATFECGSTWNFTSPTATDSCDGGAIPVVVVGTVTNASCGRTYVATRTWRATDACSNAATCSQTVTLVDTTPPVLDCGTNFSTQCGATWTFTTPTASDSCSTNVTIVQLGIVTNSLCGSTFRAIRTCKATDQCGNSTTNSQTVTVVDTIAPTLVCQADKVVACGTAWQFDLPVASDVCDGTNVVVTVFNTITNPLCGATFRATRTWKATDSCSNVVLCSQTVVLMDTVAPVLVGVPTNRTYQCVSEVPAPAVVTAVDSCDPSVAVTRTSSTNGSCPTTIIHTWSARDACSNLVTASQTIVVQGNPPIITRAPSDIAACPGSTAAFCVMAASPCGVTYQWLKNGTAIPGATNDCYNVVNPSASDVGQYCVTVSSPCDTRSACANLTILTNISIGPVPALPCLVIGTNVMICPPISGSAPYQCAWYRNGAKLTNQSSCCLNLPLLFPSDGGTYTLYVTGTCNVASADYIVPQPVVQCSSSPCDDQTVCAGAAFNLCATNFAMFPGVSYGYQWYRMTGVVSNSLPGETNQCIVRQNITAADAGFYGVVVTASSAGMTSTQLFCGGTIQVPSIPVALPLANPVVCAGGNATFCTDAGTANDHFVFEWRHNGLVMPGATNNCLQLSSITPADAGQYCVLVSGLAGITNRVASSSGLRASNICSIVSNCGTLDVLTNLFIAGPTNQNVCPGSGISLCVTPSGRGPFTYAWRKGGDLLTGQTNACLNIASAAAADAGQYCVEVASLNSCNRATNCALVIVLTNLTASPMSNVVVCAGNSFTLSTTATGTGPFTYLWTHDGTALPNVSGNSLTIGSAQLADGGQYCVKVTGACGSATQCSMVSLSAALGDFVWEDLNHNGRQDAGEPGVANASVQLLDCSSNLLATTTTDGAGAYLFTCLNPGSYRLRFVAPSGYSFTLPDLGSDDLDSDANAISGVTACVILGSGETNRTMDAGVFRPACLGDFVWEDLNGNGLQDVGEPGIPNVILRAMDCVSGSVIAITTTGPNGEYLFCGLLPGSYRVEVVLPANYNITISNVGTNDCADSDALGTRLTDCVVLASGQTNLCVDIGLKRPAALGDFVWEDLNNNGRQDVGEPGISNVTVRLLDCATMNVLATATTDATGYYLFTNLSPGIYKIGFVPPAGYVFAPANAAGVPDDADSDADMVTGTTACYTLLSGQTDLSADAGLLRPSCIGDFVWEDLNGNGVQDVGEPGIPDITLRLLDCATANVLATITTGPNGEYLFCGLNPGTYRVQVVVPGNYSITTPYSGTNDCIDSDLVASNQLTACVSVISGTMNVCIDIGLRRFAALGDFVWNDLNMNGRQDAGEPGLSNVTVRLIDCATLATAAVTVTDGAGQYLFTGLTGGTYKVSFIAPAGFLFAPPNAAGVADDADSDADAASGMTGCYTLVGGATNRTVDAGLFVPLNPCIDVSKTVACLLSGEQCGLFGKTATGYRAGTNNPAFCYSITVSNCGGWTLTNLSVIDNQLGDLTAGFFADKLTPLVPGATMTRWYKMAWDTDTTNSVSASGRAVSAGAQQVSDNDLAVAYVDNAGVTCQTIVYSPDDQDTANSDGHVTLTDDGLAHEVTFTIIVCNNGEADLANVTVNTPGISALGCGNLAPFDLPRGACRTNVLCVSRMLCANLPLSLTNEVTAIVDTRNNHCGYDIAGSNLVVRSQCHMEVECGMPGNCRVTGGGRQENTFPSVRYMTHGGQVGAPVGRAGFDPDSRCIHGNWEVVRHDKGGTRGNFHAKSFDSLLCACLACAEDPTAHV
ncbi:MAG: large repetitive protein, partial [Verrucomicrobiota bacterium]